KATKGLNQLPHVGSKVFICSTEILQSFLQDFGKNTKENPNEPAFEIANLPDDENATIKLSPQALFGRHCAIVGTTGGGKSYTVAKLLEEISKNNGKAIVIDATGEYETLKNNSKVKYVKFNDGEDSLYFHYSGLRETDLLALFRPAGQVQLPKLQEACKSLKIHRELLTLGDKIKDEHKTWIQHNDSIRKDGKDRNAFLKLEKEYGVIINSVICNFEILHLPHQVYFECIYETGATGKFGTKYERDLGLCNSLISRINSTLRNNSFINAFGIGKVDGDKNDFITIFENFIKPDSKDNLLILSVENVTSDNDLKAVLVNAIGRYLYEKALSSDKSFRKIPLILMLDEAHQFLNKKVKDEYSLEIELNAFEKIAKECRKQGLFLVLATQMPRDIPQGVLSQFGTFIVHRLINQRDREVIEYACSEATKSALSFLPILAPGEAVLAGVDFPMPIILKIKKPVITPNSDTPIIFKEEMKCNII
ncbi:ATP-binding protein, partial [Emticicia sp.]|uniref:ATP-binding protein n=1 Tax=Emticicia sp. TaxID=1930953 RepID=UPI003750E54D